MCRQVALQQIRAITDANRNPLARPGCPMKDNTAGMVIIGMWEWRRSHWRSSEPFSQYPLGVKNGNGVCGLGWKPLNRGFQRCWTWVGCLQGCYLHQVKIKVQVHQTINNQTARNGLVTNLIEVVRDLSISLNPRELRCKYLKLTSPATPFIISLLHPPSLLHCEDGYSCCGTALCP
jgi:hypothetical protein